MKHRNLLLASLSCLLLGSCSLGSKTWHYQYQRGKTAVPYGKYAVPPAGLPPRVMNAIHAGNQIAGRPYKYGGGHQSFVDSGYDCSGAVSYVLRWAGLINRPTTSSALRRFGESGEGKYITIYARKGHTFVVVAGLRFDTGYHGAGEGPNWTTKSRPLRGFKARHPPGL
jgi:hypothetical protein